MYEIKFVLHIGNIMIYLTLTTWRGHGPPTPRKLKFLKWPSSGPAQYKFIRWYKLSFLRKFQPDWPTLRGVLGWSGILWIPRQLHSMNLHFGLDMNFSKNTLLTFISVATPVGNNMVYNLESTLIENISAFPDTAICGCILAFLDHIWHLGHHWYTRCNPKTYAITFSVWQVIFGLNFRLIDQHLVLVWADLHLFLSIFTTIFGWIISDQTCNAPNAPKIYSLIIRICMKLNLCFILAILWYTWH